jgi:hypothetical protein
MEMKKASDEIKGKKQKIVYLERHIKGKLDQLDLQLVLLLVSIGSQLFIL